MPSIEGSVNTALLTRRKIRATRKGQILYKVVIRREFPSKKRGQPLSWHILQDTNFFVKWRAENFAYGLLFVTKSFSYGLWFSGNNSISGATSLNSLRKECLIELNNGAIFCNFLCEAILASMFLRKMDFSLISMRSPSLLRYIVETYTF